MTYIEFVYLDAGGGEHVTVMEIHTSALLPSRLSKAATRKGEMVIISRALKLLTVDSLL